MTTTIPFGKLEENWRRDPAFVAAFARIGPAMEMAFALADARREAGLTQVDVAVRMGTSQATVARLQGGRVKPTWATIQRYAQAVGKRPVVRLLATE